MYLPLFILYQISAAIVAHNRTMNMIIFAAGSILYACIEILFRGYTHWTMMLTGGACALTIYYINLELPHLPLLLRALAGTFTIIFFEFAVGLIVNFWFGWNIWDYSNVPGNIMGQICPQFSLAWFLLSLLLCSVFTRINKKSTPERAL
jgi:uncharacterized membrane protein